jgi:type I restriction enzyme, R subunit
MTHKREIAALARPGDAFAPIPAEATGTGKTKLAIALLYRLLATKRFRRICFVVDRSALGDQAAGEFTTTKIVSGKAFADIFGLKKLADVTPEGETKVHICTIQGLVKRVLYAADSSEAPPVDQYDLMVVDECHRGYLLDRKCPMPSLASVGRRTTSRNIGACWNISTL